MSGFDPSSRFPRWLVMLWWLVVPSAAPLFLRLLYEETVLTWRRGPQMVGYTMAHQFAWVLVLGLFGYLATVLWLLIAVVILIRRRCVPRGLDRLYLMLPAAAVAISFVPYSVWASLGGVKVP